MLNTLLFWGSYSKKGGLIFFLIQKIWKNKKKSWFIRDTRTGMLENTYEICQDVDMLGITLKKKTAIGPNLIISGSYNNCMFRKCVFFVL